MQCLACDAPITTIIRKSIRIQRFFFFFVFSFKNVAIQLKQHYRILNGRLIYRFPPPQFPKRTPRTPIRRRHRRTGEHHQQTHPRFTPHLSISGNDKNPRLMDIYILYCGNIYSIASIQVFIYYLHNCVVVYPSYRRRAVT